MHRTVTLPFLFPIVISILIYGIGLPIVQTNKDSLAAAVVVSVLWYISGIVSFILMGLFVRVYFEERLTAMESLLGFFNSLFGAVHIVAAVGMTLWLLDTSVGKTAVFDNIPADKSYFATFIFYFLATTGNSILGGGFVTLSPTPDAVLPALWSLFGGVVGILVLSLIFSVVTFSLGRNIRRARRL